MWPTYLYLNSYTCSTNENEVSTYVFKYTYLQIKIGQLRKSIIQSRDGKSNSTNKLTLVQSTGNIVPKGNGQSLNNWSDTTEEACLCSVHAKLLEVDTHEGEQGAKGSVKKEVEQLVDETIKSRLEWNLDNEMVEFLVWPLQRKYKNSR